MSVTWTAATMRLGFSNFLCHRRVGSWEIEEGVVWTTANGHKTGTIFTKLQRMEVSAGFWVMWTRQSGNGLSLRPMSEVKVAFRRFHLVRIIPRNQLNSCQRSRTLIVSTRTTLSAKIEMGRRGRERKREKRRNKTVRYTVQVSEKRVIWLVRATEYH